MADVTVRGAGIFGLSIAWACLLRGASVQVVDPYGIGAGSSGGVLGALAPHIPENWNEKKAFQLDSLLMAADFWAGVEQVGGKATGYGRTGRLQPVATLRALERARSRQTGAQGLWGNHATWSVTREEPEWAPLSPTGYLIHDTLSARLHPRLACDALAAAIRARGGKVLSEAPDQGAVIWACGAKGLDMLNAQLDRDVGTGEKGQAALLQLPTPPPKGAPQIYADAVHVVPHGDGTVAIGSTSERHFDDPAGTDAQLDELIARAAAAVPVLAGAQVIKRWAGVRPRTRSRAPMLGAHPLHKGHFIANGGYKIGFGMAPKVADVMAGLVLEGVDAIPCDFNIAASL